MTKAELRRAIRKHPDGARILAAVDRARREGWRIKQGLAFVQINGDEKACCPLGALDTATAEFEEAADAELDWPHERAWSFATGFDGDSWSSALPETRGRFRGAFTLGRLFRRLLFGEAAS